MTKTEGNPNDESRMNDQRSVAFELRASSFIRHSSFVIRHSGAFIAA
jgi:hypothetical protein